MAVASQPTLIIATDVTNDAGARAWLSPMALQATEVLRSGFAAVAAVGDDHGEEGQTWLAAGLTPGVARPIPSAHQKRGLCSQEACP